MGYKRQTITDAPAFKVNASRLANQYRKVMYRWPNDHAYRKIHFIKLRLIVFGRSN